ncbi:MAG TPA: sugar phosphate nucleotidyltransferase [Candidatus Wallbacteria bacterium]|nr:MAG: Glucose-1-phosphate adenylyltransferase [bacterium ADurb.Bin243]HOD40204.1 sugar phosphate nucleotidyltransferase [Candidatus Wallbacteria bacterium]HPG58960.1 sugar phosphate nucleotidyltransferase [Candidatus Wallbacteria bacterium]
MPKISESTLSLILAGGKGERLMPLTIDRAKPAVPIGGNYRIIDFTLNNCVNSHIRRIYLLTQFKSQSLDRHVRSGWNMFSDRSYGFVETLPPQQRVSEDWYRGTADAVWQNVYSIKREKMPYTLILSGDHIYKMDYSEMFRQHLENNADLTVATIEEPIANASSFGIIEVDTQGRIIGFEEKPANPKCIPGDPDHSLVSMGIYLFNTETLLETLNMEFGGEKELVNKKVLFEKLKEDAGAYTRFTTGDFGYDIISNMVRINNSLLANGSSMKYNVFSYNFRDENRKMAKYWRDVGTIKSYWESNMDLKTPEPELNLYKRHNFNEDISGWPLRSYKNPFLPPAKFVFSPVVSSSLICDGVIICNATVRDSVISTCVNVQSNSIISDSILFDNVRVGQNCKLNRVIIDKDAIIGDNQQIGFNADEDLARGFTVIDGITVVPRGTRIGETYRGFNVQTVII